MASISKTKAYAIFKYLSLMARKKPFFVLIIQQDPHNPLILPLGKSSRKPLYTIYIKKTTYKIICITENTIADFLRSCFKTGSAITNASEL